VNKSEALAVMHEVLGVLRESVLISGVSLDFAGSKISKSPEDYLIKLKCDLDDSSRKLIEPILDKRNLKIEVIEDAVMIYLP
jgi:hypothetical protein